MPEREISSDQRTGVTNWVNNKIKMGAAEKIDHIVPLGRVFIVDHEPLILDTDYEDDGVIFKEKNKLFSSEKLIHDLEDDGVI